MQDPQPEFRPVAGQAETLAPGLRRVLAPNPSPMTYRGTNTYLVGEGDVAVIDPGPDDPAHLAAILGALRPGEAITHIFVTHAHLDHSPLARPLSRATGAPVLAFSDAQGGRSEVMTELAARGMAGGGEGVDRAFVPDRKLDDGETVTGGEWHLTALHTPGHFGNHLCFAWGDMLFSGDLVMGWASSLVSPPDGDLTQFMASCQRLRGGGWTTFHAGHGAPISDPSGRVEWLIAHRRSREAEILGVLEGFEGTPSQIAARIYTDVPAALLPAATRNVFAHLVDLHGKNIVSSQGELGPDSLFSLV